MYGGALPTASSTQSLPSPRETARARAFRATLRLRTVLRHVSALRCAQQQGDDDHVSLPQNPIAAAQQAASSLPPASPSPPFGPSTAPTTVAEEAASSQLPPCLLHLECPLAPLAQRVKRKAARDAHRQKRRDARQAAATAAVPTTAADMVRNALSQPLGVVASRFLSAAGSGAPLLFPNVAITSASATDNHMRNWSSSKPPLSAIQGAHTPPSTTVASAPQPGISPLGAGSGEHTFSPSPAASVRKTPYPSSPLRVRGQSSLHRRSHHPHERVPSNVSASHRSRDSADDGPSPLAQLLSTPPSGIGSQGLCSCHHPLPRRPEQRDRHRHRARHHRYHCHRQCRGAHEAVGCAPAAAQCATMDAMRKHQQGCSSSQHQDETLATKSSPPVDVFSSSPISFLTRTLREAGTAALVASPPSGGEKRHIPATDLRSYARHSQCSRRAEMRERSEKGANARVAASSPTRARWSGSAGSPYIGGSPHAAGKSFPQLSRSSYDSPCACSRSTYDSWSGSESLCSASSSRMSSVLGVHSPPCELFTPLTIPLDGRYDPDAPLLPLMRCYGNTPTREVFCSVLSTSTQHTASRSSTPMSSGWSAELSSTGTTVAVAAAAPAAGFRAPNAPEEAVKRTAHEHCGGEPAERQQQLNNHHRQPSMPLSTTNTQLSYVAEMDAIERGVVAPYVSYLFSPEVRVIDLRQLKDSVSPGDPAPPLEATCIGFSRVSGVYLVGTSSGVLWRVPVGGGAEAMRATPLGSLWPLHAATSAKPATITALGSASAAKGSPGGAGGASGSGGSTPLPVPLPGHTAAILSIAFNDDGALFATTGMDGCVIVWNASTSAKLRRINAVWASAASPSSAAAPASKYAGVDEAADQRAPHLVRFMPQNNNYLLVSYLSSSELHLYNSSTGLPVTNAAGTGLARAAASTTTAHRTGTRGSHDSSGAGPGTAASSGVITALAVDIVASPFFFSGDASGTVVLWMYRAGNVVAKPTLRATAAASPLTTLAGSDEGKHAHTRSYVVDPLLHGRLGSNGDGMAAFSTPLYLPPELRRVTALALPEQMGGIAALGVSALHISQLYSLFRHRGPRQGAESAQSTSKGGPASERSAPPHPLEPTAHVFRAAAQQNRACWAAADALRASDETAAADGTARNRRDAHGRSGGQPHSAVHGTPASHDKSRFPKALAELPSRLSETLSALWRGGGGAPSSAAHSGPAPATQEEKFAAAEAKASAAPATALSEDELLHQLRNDALDVVCPLLVLATLPCDTIYALGVLLQLQPGSRRRSAAGEEGVVGAATPTVTYRLYPLLKTTSPSRLRHLGVGAVQSPDNPRLIIVATPCEEGFVRVEPLLRFATPSPPEQRTSPVGVSTAPTPGVGCPQPSNTAAAPDAGGRRSHGHVLATLPMPYGGRCTGVAWSPNGRFLVAITAEGVIYQWARVYLLDPSSPSANATAAATAAAAATRKGDVAQVGDGGNAAPAHSVGSVKGEVEVRSSLAAGATVAAAARRRGCVTERSDAMNGAESPAAKFTGLLGAPMASAVAPPSGLAVGENTAARAAFDEEDAWRESFQRELERQRRAQAAMKLVAHDGFGEEYDTMSSSAYWLDDDGVANSAVTEDSLEGEETESSL
ncbi:hypothetical protein LSCM4_01865 [Leishmania orientalis]|uniref:Guanine nucleotide-binding protein subunit beta-like protein n=1 Tax=Leishmania orientalis TaxID=2249476 RepID=A0A836KV45_9TRYP|nr:hypothetical protein LSCM4_01865 [Leishmania orientalis]